MKLNGILSDRHFQTWPSWQIVYEWENEISQALGIPLLDSPPANKDYENLRFKDSRFAIRNIKNAVQNVFTFPASVVLYFEMNPTYAPHFANSRKTIPVIIDFWDKSNVHLFKKAYRSSRYLLIQNLEVMEFLNEHHIKNQLIHFPISLPSMYTLKPDAVFEKKYDILLTGRINSVLVEYLHQYRLTHPDLEYLHHIQLNGVIHYVSNQRGTIGKFHSRTSYIQLLQSSRVAFYSTPGIDGGEARTNGFNPVTARIFEFLAAGCHVLARYPKNADTDFFQLDSICPSIQSYTDFENQLTHALNSPPPVKNNSDYLLRHYTSKRIELLKSIQ